MMPKMVTSKGKQYGCTTKGCKKTFFITNEQEKWYQEKGYQIPTHCEDCRKAKRSRLQYTQTIGDVVTEVKE